MQQAEYFVFTQLLVDDLEFPDGRHLPGVLGGGAYTAAGMRIWSDRVGVCSRVGADFGEYRGWFDDNGICTAGAVEKFEKGPRSRLVYSEDEERVETPLPGHASMGEAQPRVEDIPAGYGDGRGMYIFKDCDEDFWESLLRYLHAHPGLVSVWEILGAAAVPENREKIAACLEKVDIFSLNRTEGRRLTGKDSPEDIVRAVVDLGAGAVQFRMSAQGALVSDGRGIWHVPAAPSAVVDVTGGGNAATGGFLVGWCASGGDPCRAGVCGSVSASLVLEQVGLPPRIDGELLAQARARAQALAVTRVR